jgi:hypothetical protein
LEVSGHVWIHIGRRRLVHNPRTVQLSARNHAALLAFDMTENCNISLRSSYVEPTCYMAAAF